VRNLTTIFLISTFASIIKDAEDNRFFFFLPFFIFILFFYIFWKDKAKRRRKSKAGYVTWPLYNSKDSNTKS